MARSQCPCRVCQLSSSMSVFERAVALLCDLISQTASETERSKLEHQLAALNKRHGLKSAA